MGVLACLFGSLSAEGRRAVATASAVGTPGTPVPPGTGRRLGRARRADDRGGPHQCDGVDQGRCRALPAARTVDDVLHQFPASACFVAAVAWWPIAPHGVSLRSIGPSGVSRTLVLLGRHSACDGCLWRWVYWSKVPLESIEHIEVVHSVHPLWELCPGRRDQVPYSEASAAGSGQDRRRHARHRRCQCRHHSRQRARRAVAAGKCLGAEGIRSSRSTSAVPLTSRPMLAVDLSWTRGIPPSPMPRCLSAAVFTRTAAMARRCRTPPRRAIEAGGTLLSNDGSTWQVSLYSQLQTFAARLTDRQRSRLRSLDARPGGACAAVGGWLQWTKRMFQASADRRR